MKKDIGKKIEKNIRYNEKVDTYYVLFNFKDVTDLKGFPTLEDARSYRDAINAEKLRIKKEEGIASLRKAEREEIIQAEKIYPYNALEAVGLKDVDVNPEIIEHFAEILFEACTEREELCIRRFYEDNLTLADIGEEFNLSRERIRQIIIKGLKKVKFYVHSYEHMQEKKLNDELAKDNLEHLKAKREELISLYREKGVISEEMTAYFGEPTFCYSVNGYIEHLRKTATIDDLDLSIRSYNCLKRAGILTVDELIKLTTDDLHNIKNLGKKSAKEIKEHLHSMGLFLKDEEY